MLLSLSLSLSRCACGRNRKGPSLLDILIVFLLEALHTFGLSLLVFRVLPSCDVVRATLLTNALCLLPALLKLAFAKTHTGTVAKALTVLVDLLALTAQLSVLFVIVGTEFTAFTHKTKVPGASSDPAKPGNDDPFADSEPLTIGNGAG